MIIRKFFMLPDDGGAGGSGLIGGAAGNGAAGAASGAQGAGAGAGTDGGSNGGAGAFNQGANAPSGGNGAITGQPAVEFQSFSVPESFGGIDPDTHSQIVSLAKESGMTQAQAQKWVDIGAKKFDDGMSAVRLEIIKKFEEWEGTSKNDPEIKPYLNENGKLPKISEIINRAMGDETQAFHDMAEETGIGANPLFIKFCIRMTKLMGEAPFVGGSVGGGKQMSMLEQAKTMFPNM